MLNRKLSLAGLLAVGAIGRMSRPAEYTQPRVNRKPKYPGPSGHTMETRIAVGSRAFSRRIQREGYPPMFFSGQNIATGVGRWKTLSKRFIGEAMQPDGVVKRLLSRTLQARGGTATKEVLQTV